MHMVIYMFLTEAVIALASGTIAELEIGILGIRFSADSAFVAVIFLCVFHFCGCDLVSEVNRGFIVSGSAAPGHIKESVAAEDEEVEHGDEGQEVGGEGAEDYADNKEGGVNKSEPLYFNRNNEKQKKLSIGEQQCESEEHGQVYIAGVKEHILGSRQKTCHKAVNHCEDNAGKVIERELSRAPVTFKSRAYEIRKVQRENQSPQTVVSRDKYKCHQSPDFTA